MVAQFLVVDIVKNKFQRLQKQFVVFLNLTGTIADEVHSFSKDDRCDGLLHIAVCVYASDQVLKDFDDVGCFILIDH